MKNKKILIAAITGSIIAITAGFTTPASAACLNSIWKKTSGTSPAHTIKGRTCGANQSVRFIGTVDTGWIPMHNSGPAGLTAKFVDAFFTTVINMYVNGTNMDVILRHSANNGVSGSTQGQYNLVYFQ